MCSGQRLHPSNLTYQGAFRLPDTSPFEYGWYWGGSAMTFYPHGDPGGEADGFPGSIFGVGHDWNMYVAEISIPQPVISVSKNLDELPTARLLQDFHNVRGDLFLDEEGNLIFYEMIRVGMAFLPAQVEQSTDKLHFTWGQHLQEGTQNPSHMWCELDLSHPQPQGEWMFGHYSNYTSTDYMFTIPQSWTDEHVPGQRLATGRFRDGLWSGHGPALYAFQPWQEDHHARGDTIEQITPLLLYGIQEPGNQHIQSDTSMQMNNFKEADDWIGGAWLSDGHNQAVVLAGTKGIGECWYGLPDRTLWEEPYPEDPLNQRGWWCESFEAQIIFFDVHDLARVADGDMNSWEPQPFASLHIDPYLFSIDSSQQQSRLASVSYDRENNHLYIMERRGDGDKPLVHAWSVETPIGVKQKTDSFSAKLNQNVPNPFNATTKIQFDIETAGAAKLIVYDALGRHVATLVNQHLRRGSHTAYFEGKSSGIYFYQLETERSTITREMLLIK